MTVRSTRRVGPGEIDQRDTRVAFDPGFSEEEFWDNYHAAIREAINESWEDFHDDYPDIDRDEDSYGESVATVGVAA